MVVDLRHPTSCHFRRTPPPTGSRLIFSFEWSFSLRLRCAGKTSRRHKDGGTGMRTAGELLTGRIDGVGGQRPGSECPMAIESHPDWLKAEVSMRVARSLLLLGIAVPFLYFGTLFIAASTWPAYSHVTRYASELGSAEAPKPWIFNGGIVFMGIVCVLAAWGFGSALIRMTGRKAMGFLAALCLGLFGVSMVMGGMFPMPNPLHGGFGLGFALAPAPLFMGLALRGESSWAGLRRFLWVSTALMGATLAVMMGVGHLVTRQNVGLWQRINALAMFPWIAVAAGWLRALLARGDVAVPVEDPRSFTK